MNKKWKMSQLILTYILVLFGLFMGIIIYLNVFVLKDIRERESARERDLLENWVNIWDNMLENNTIFINNFMANNSGVIRLDMARTPQERNYAMQEIKATLNEYALLNNGMTEIFFFFEQPEGKFVLTNKKTVSISDSRTATQRVHEIMDAYFRDGGANRWAIVKTNGQNDIVYVCEKNGKYLGCWCSVDYLIKEATKTSHSTSRFFIADGQGISRTDGYLDGEFVDPGADRFRNASNGEEYLQIAQKSGLINLYFLEHIEKSAAEAAVRSIQSIMIGVCVFLGIFLVIMSGLLERLLYRPIRRLVTHMA